MRLSEVFGEPDWNVVLEKIDPWQYMLWRAKDALEGIGHKRDDRRSTEMTAWLLAAAGCKGITVDKLAYDIESRLPKPSAKKGTKNRSSTPTKESTRAAIFGAMGISVPPPPQKKSKVKRGK